MFRELDDLIEIIKPIDWVKVLRPNGTKVGHLGDVIPSQSQPGLCGLGLISVSATDVLCPRKFFGQ